MRFPFLSDRPRTTSSSEQASAEIAGSTMPPAAVLAAALLLLSPSSDAQTGESDGPEVGPFTYFTLALATGERTFGPPPDKDGTSYSDLWTNNDQSGRAGFLGAVASPTEILDWGVISTSTGTDIVSRISFGYATTALDDSIGGDGADIVLRFYTGVTGYCTDVGTAPVATLKLSGLPGSTDGLPKGYVTTVILTGGDEFCLPAGPFGFGFQGLDQTTGGFFDATVPLLCFAGDDLGNPLLDPDTNGQVSLVDRYVPDVQTGVCTGSFGYGGGIDDASLLLYLETPDTTSGPAASATFRNGSGANPANHTVAVPPILGELYSAADVQSNGGTGVFLFGYEGDLAGIPTPFGELLVDPGSPNALSGMEGPYVFNSSGQAGWRLQVPCDLDLCGFEFSTQTLEFGAGLQLHNAQDLVVGF